MKKTITREPAASSTYDCDFYEWTQRVAEELRQGRLSDPDAELVAEEIADMGKRDRRELRSRMIVLLTHLLKWAAQPKLRQKSTWIPTINEQRLQIEQILNDSHSLAAGLIEELPKICGRAADWAVSETGLPSSAFAPPAQFFRDALANRLNQTLMKWLSSDYFPENKDDLFS